MQLQGLTSLLTILWIECRATFCASISHESCCSAPALGNMVAAAERAGCILPVLFDVSLASVGKSKAGKAHAVKHSAHPPTDDEDRCWERALDLIWWAKAQKCQVKPIGDCKPARVCKRLNRQGQR